MFAGPWLTKMTSDSNAGALDAGFDAAMAFIESADPSVSLHYIDKLLSNVVDKAFPAKTSTLNKGKIFVMIVFNIFYRTNQLNRKAVGFKIDRNE